MVKKSEEDTRAYNAGKLQAESIIENVHLMYQNETARKYYKGLLDKVVPEAEKRGVKIKR